MMEDMDLYGLAEHEDFERGSEDMERRAYRMEAEREAEMEAHWSREEISEYDVPEDPCGHGDVTHTYRLVCLECGHRFTTQEDETDECVNCGGSDLELQ